MSIAFNYIMPGNGSSHEATGENIEFTIYCTERIGRAYIRNNTFGTTKYINYNGREDSGYLSDDGCFWFIDWLADELSIDTSTDNPQYISNSFTIVVYGVELSDENMVQTTISIEVSPVIGRTGYATNLKVNGISRSHSGSQTIIDGQTVYLVNAQGSKAVLTWDAPFNQQAQRVTSGVQYTLSIYVYRGNTQVSERTITTENRTYTLTSDDLRELDRNLTYWNAHFRFQVRASGSSQWIYFKYSNPYKTVKYRINGEWVECEPKYFNGESFVPCEPKYYNGSEWVECSHR